MSAAVAPAPTAVPDVRTEIRLVLEAREKFLTILTALDTERRTAVADLVKQVAKDLAAPGVPSSDRLFDAHKNWKTKDDRIAEKIAAVEDLAKQVQARVDELKVQPALREELAGVLRLKIAALRDFQASHDQESAGLSAQIKKLQEELDALGYAGPAPTSSARAKSVKEAV